MARGIAIAWKDILPEQKMLTIAANWFPEQFDKQCYQGPQDQINEGVQVCGARKSVLAFHTSRPRYEEDFMRIKLTCSANIETPVKGKLHAKGNM
jgi:hypothetical protein